MRPGGLWEDVRGATPAPMPIVMSGFIGAGLAFPRSGMAPMTLPGLRAQISIGDGSQRQDAWASPSQNQMAGVAPDHTAWDELARGQRGLIAWFWVHTQHQKRQFRA